MGDPLHVHGTLFIHRLRVRGINDVSVHARARASGVVRWGPAPTAAGPSTCAEPPLPPPPRVASLSDAHRPRRSQQACCPQQACPALDAHYVAARVPKHDTDAHPRWCVLRSVLYRITSKVHSPVLIFQSRRPFHHRRGIVRNAPERDAGPPAVRCGAP